jgi:O-methyltransferase involved in polyketide biosynthesis
MWRSPTIAARSRASKAAFRPDERLDDRSDVQSTSRDGVSASALYTCGVWTWAGLAGAHLLACRPANVVFGATTLVLAIPTAILRKPRLRESLVQRHLMIDHLARGAPVVLELAAGLSARGVRMSSDPDVTYTEVDLPATMSYKRRLLARAHEGQAVLARPNLSLIEADVLAADLTSLCRAKPGAPLVVIVEGLFMYLSADAQRSLWQRIRGLFDRRPGTLIFDLVPFVEQGERTAFGRALGWMQRRASRGVGFVRDRRTRHDIARELTELGFAVEMLEPRDVPAGWQLPHLDARTQQLVFVCRGQGARQGQAIEGAEAAGGSTAARDPGNGPRPRGSTRSRVDRSDPSPGSSDRAFASAGARTRRRNATPPESVESLPT